MQVGIIGAGTMGRGIAQVAATAGHKVFIYDPFEQALEKAKEYLHKTIESLISKNKITSNKGTEIISQHHFTTDIGVLSSVGIIIEAIIENKEVKLQLFNQCEQVVTEDCIIASNTSSLSITSLAASLKRPERFIGIHFFNPAPVMKLVEVIPALQTSDNCVKKSIDLIKSWNKITVQAKDTPGFIVNRIARPYYGEALRIAEEMGGDEITMRTIDMAMTAVGKYPMGPFELMDFIGHDVNYNVTEIVWRELYYDSKYKPSLSQKKLVEAGYFGKKSGKGFYNYATNTASVLVDPDYTILKQYCDRINVMLINEAYQALQLQIATREDIELAITKGVNYPKGLFALSEEIGLQTCVEELDKLFQFYHEERYRCCGLLRTMASEK